MNYLVLFFLLNWVRSLNHLLIGLRTLLLQRSQVVITELFLILILESEPKFITDLQTLQNIIRTLDSHP